MESAAELPKELLDLDLINSKLVHALKQLQLKRIRAEIELHQKVHDLHTEYQAKLGEYDEKRAKIISGEYVPTEEETKYEFVDENFPAPSEIKDKGIPHFWPIIFHNLDILSEMIQETDEPLLNHLVDVRSVLLKEPRGFRLEFEFSENEWFSNKVLTKEYYYSDKVDPFEPLQNEGLIIERAVGCTIEWKSPEKNLTMKKIAKKLKHKADNTVKSVEKMEKIDSFFNFFDPPSESLENADEDTRELLVSDFDIGETLRQSVIPRAVIYFTGEGIEDDDEYDEDMDEEDFDEFDEDDDEEEDEDDGEEDDEEDKNKKSSSNKPASSSKSSKSRGGSSSNSTKRQQSMKRKQQQQLFSHLSFSSVATAAAVLLLGLLVVFSWQKGKK